MTIPLNVLIIDDEPDDAELLIYELHRAGFDPVWTRVDTERDYLAYLQNNPDIILADYSMPQLNIPRALDLLHERSLDIPLIVVTGSVTEQVVVETMQKGVTDYLLKDRLTRLGQAVTHALDEKKLRAEKRQAEQDLRESEARFRRLAENAQDIIFRYYVTPTRGLEYINPAVLTITGYTPSECYANSGLPFTLIYAADEHRLEDLFAPGNDMSRPTVMRWTHKNGTLIWVELRSVFVYSNDGKLTAIEGVARDVTEQKRSELALQESEIRYRLVAQATNDAIWDWDLAKNTITWNDSVQSLFGFAALEVGTDVSWWLEHIHPQDRERVVGNVYAIIRSGEHMWSDEYRYLRADNTYACVMDRGYVVHNVEGEPTRMIGAMADITEQKQAQQILEQERNLLRTLIDNLPDYIFVKDMEGRFLLSNIAHTRASGLKTANELVGKLASGFFQNDLATQYDTDDMTVMQTGKPLINVERQTVDSAGNPRWVLTTKVPLRENAEKVIGLVGISHDITERKYTEEALRRSEAAEREQRTLAEALRDIVATLTSTLDTKIVLTRILETVGRVVPHDAANIMLIEGPVTRVVAWHGYAPPIEAFFTTNYLSYETIPYLAQMVRNKASCLISDTASDAELNMSSELNWGRSYLASPILVHGEVIGFLNLHSQTVGFFTAPHIERLQAFADPAAVALENAQLYDEIRRHALELERRVDERTSELRLAKENVEVILNNSTDAIILLGPDQAIQRTNPAFQALFGYSITDILGREAATLVEANQTHSLLEALDIVANNHLSRRIEVVARHKEGTVFNADIALSAIVQNNGQPQLLGIVCSVRDITERKLVEKELQELNRLKTEFLSTAAHELRTPLTSIRGFSEILLTRQLDPDRQKRYLSLIEEQAKQLGNLVDDLLDISRLEAKRTLSLSLQPINMIELINEVAIPFRESTSSHQIQIEAAADCPPIMGDVMRLSEVIKNLLSNAIKYSPQGKTVVIEVGRIPHFLRISVQDHGIGLTPEQHAHLFEKFYRADASNLAITGTGLGLAICKSIVELHGGQILAESTYGVGTTFRFTLPLFNQ